MSQLESKKYRPDVDGLRGIAVLLVVGFHAFPDILTGGFIGVDVFFLISGFLITSIIVDDLERKLFSLKDFYFRRVRRIFPALLLVLYFISFFGWIDLLPKEYEQLGKHIGASALFVNNFIILSEGDYFDVSAHLKPLLHLWSLGVEEQFYIIWPMIIFICWRVKANIRFVIILLGVISLFASAHITITDMRTAFFSPLTRFWELLAGCFLALQGTRHRNAEFSLVRTNTFSNTWLSNNIIIWRSRINVDDVLSLMGAAILVFGVISINKDSDFPGLWALIPITGSFLIVFSGANAWINKRILSRKILVGLGLISFPLYLWHWPLLSLGKILANGILSTEVRTFIVCFSIVAAWLTYKFVEVPIRRFGISKKLIFVLVLLMLFIGLFGFSVSWHGGYKSRFKNQLEIHELVSNPLPQVRDIDCSMYISEFKNVKFDAGCRISKMENPEIAFVGDSHMAQYRFPIWQRFQIPLIMIVETSCLPFSSVYFMKDDCKKKYDLVLNYIESNPGIHTVVLSGYWSYLMGGGFGEKGENWRHAKVVTDVGVRTFIGNAKNMITRLHRSGKTIIFMRDIPDLDFDINTCLNLRPISFAVGVRDYLDCSISEEAFKNRIALYDRVIASLLTDLPFVRFYDPRPLFCREGRCRAFNGELPLYFNGDHVNSYGADFIISDMINAMGVRIQ